VIIGTGRAYGFRITVLFGSALRIRAFWEIYWHFSYTYVGRFTQNSTKRLTQTWDESTIPVQWERFGGQPNLDQSGNGIEWRITVLWGNQSWRGQVNLVLVVCTLRVLSSLMRISCAKLWRSFDSVIFRFCIYPKNTWAH